MNFRVMFPPGYNFHDNTKKYPVIMMLHGAGESGRVWTGRYVYDDSDPRYDNNGHNILHGGNEHRIAVQRPANHPQGFPGILVFPQSSYSGSWGEVEGLTMNENETLIAAFIEEQLVSRYHADINRISVHGLSNGARGTWAFAKHRPDLFAAILPMSGIPNDNAQTADILVTTPIRLFQGGTDTNPSPGGAQSIINALVAVGGNPQLFFYPTLGHGTWTTAYAEPDFFSWILAKDKKNIYVFGGDPSICPGGTLRLGFSAGYTSYQWTKDGADIIGETTRYLNVNVTGVYTVKFTRPNGTTDESFPTTVAPKSGSTFSPVLTNSGSKILPVTLNGGGSLGSINNSVILTAPIGYSQYFWYKNGNLVAATPPPGGAANTNQVSVNAGGINDAGNYQVKVQEATGCQSEFSNTITLVYTTPHTSPGQPTNVTATPVSSTDVRLNWVQNIANETGFEIWRNRQNSNGYVNQPFRLIGTVPANTTTYLDKGVRPGARYFYRIRAVSATDGMFGETGVAGGQGVADMLPDNEPPTPPVNLVASNIKATEVTLTWEPSVDNDVVHKYEVYLNSVLRKVVWNDSTTAGANDVTDGNPAPATNYTITGLQPGTTYIVSVRAIDFRNNRSAFADAIPVTTEGAAGAGLVRNYYHYTNSLPTTPAGTNLVQNVDFANLTPVFTDVVTNGFPITGRLQNDFFIFTYEGYVQINTAGNYIFRTDSDDGSVLYIDDVRIVNNDNLHGNGTFVQGTASNLSIGRHKIKVLFFEQGGGEVLTVQWDVPGSGTNFVPIPAAQLFLSSVNFVNYYSKSTGDLATLGTWGTSTNGSGSAPSSFTSSYQVFNLNNRTVVSTEADIPIAGNGSKLVVGTNITLNLNHEMTGRIEGLAGSVINLNNPVVPTFGTLAATSTVNMNVDGILPNGAYGNVNVNTAFTTVTLPINAVIVKGNLVVADEVQLLGSDLPYPNQSRLQIDGNITFQGTSGTGSSPAGLYSLSFKGNKTHTITSDNQDVSLYELKADFGDVIQFNFNSVDPYNINIGRQGGGGGLALASGARLVVGNNNLIVNGTSGININDETGVVEIVDGNMTFNTTSDRNSNLVFGTTSNRLTDLTLNLTGDGKLNVGSPVELTDLMTLTGQVNTFGNLKLLSNENGSARIGPLPTGSRINGEIAAQRFMEEEGQIWRYISSPVKGVKVADLQAFFPITGNFTGASTGPGMTSNPSMYHYQEPTGYIVFPPAGGTNQDTLRTAKGYSPFIRNDQTPTTFEVKGLPNQGTISIPVNPDTPTTDGWNLVGNPYPAPIRWSGNSTGGWTMSGINNTVSVRENWEGGFAFRTWNGSTGNFDGIIAPGQGFWVQSTSASPSLTVAEAAKSITDGSFYRVSAPANTIEVKMSNATLHDETFIQFIVGATTAYDKDLDAIKQSNSFFNLSTNTSDGQRVAINLTSPDACAQEIIFLTENAPDGTYALDIEGVESLLYGDKVEFIDNFTGTTVELTGAYHHPFTITSAAASKATGRFRLRLTKPSVLINLDIASQVGCNSTDPVVFITQSQPGVSYTAFINGSAVSQPVVGTGEQLAVPVDHNLIDYGKYNVSVQATYQGCAQPAFLSQTVNVTRDTMNIPHIAMTEGVLATELQATTYQWYLNGEQINGATSPQFEPAGFGDFYLEVSEQNCTTTSTLFTREEVMREIEIISSEAACDTDPVISLISSQPGVVYRGYVNGKAVTAPSVGTGGDLNITLPGNEISNGTHGVIVKGAFPNDKQFDMFNVVEVGSNFIATPSIEVEATTLKATTTGESYKWFVNGVQISGATGPQFDPQTDGVYEVQLQSGNCTKTSIPLNFSFHVSLDLALSTTAVCGNADPSITVSNSQPGVKYAVFNGATQLSDYFTGNGGDLTMTVPANLVQAGETNVQVKAGYANNTQYTLNEGTMLRKFELAMPLLELSNGVLVTNITNATYQWFKDDELISGATAAVLTPEESGIYSVEVTNGSCVKKSDPLEFIVLGFEDELSIKAFPNPFNEKIMVRLREPVDQASIRSFTQIGQEVRVSIRKVSDLVVEVDYANATPGVYILYVNRQYFKVVKQ
jgi:predicted esterase